MWGLGMQFEPFKNVENDPNRQQLRNSRLEADISHTQQFRDTIKTTPHDDSHINIQTG